LPYKIASGILCYLITLLVTKSNKFSEKRLCLKEISIETLTYVWSQSLRLEDWALVTLFVTVSVHILQSQCRYLIGWILGDQQCPTANYKRRAYVLLFGSKRLHT
jgi:hypothetical protein